MAFGAFDATIGSSHRPDRRDYALANPKSLCSNEMHEEMHDLFTRTVSVLMNAQMVANQNINRDIIDAVRDALSDLPNTQVVADVFERQGDSLVATISSSNQPLTALWKKAYSITPDLNYGHEKLSIAVRQVAQSESLDPRYIYRIVSPYFVYSEDELTGSAIFRFLELASHS